MGKLILLTKESGEGAVFGSATICGSHTVSNKNSENQIGTKDKGKKVDVSMCIDGFHIALGLSGEMASEASHSILSSLKSKDGLFTYLKSSKEDNVHEHFPLIGLNLPTGKTIRLLRYPYSYGGINYVFCLNPAKLLAADIHALKYEFNMLCMSENNAWAYLVANGFMKRMDLAIDVPVPIDDYVFALKYAKVTKSLGKLKSGLGLYAGSKHSQLQVHIYDKKAQLKTQNVSISNPVRTRIELRHRVRTPLKDVPKYKVADLSSRLLVIDKKLVDFPFDFVGKDKLIEGLLTSNHLDLSELKPYPRQKVRKHLEACCQPPWWQDIINSLYMLQTWKSMIDKTELLKTELAVPNYVPKFP